MFKKKNEQDGSIRFKGHIVVRRFVQIPGIYFTNTHSPVAQDSAIKIALCLPMYLEDWEVEMIDIVAAFLEFELDEEIYYQMARRVGRTWLLYRSRDGRTMFEAGTRPAVFRVH